MSKSVKKKGFTLVELVVVLAIFGLLASITGLGLYSWTRYSINKENNENARTIFLAAQESLTHMQASGTLKDFGEFVVSKGDDEDFGAIQKTPLAIASAANRSDGLYTIFYEPGTLDRYQSEVNTLIKETILPYLEGTGVFSHPFVLEINPVDGVVYSAFYSSKADSLYYEDEEDTNIINESGKVGIYHRTEGILKDRLLGFYHTELTVAKPTEIPAVNFVSAEPEDTELLVNKDELYFRIPTTSETIDKSMLKTDYSYIVEISGIDSKDKAQKIAELSFNLNGMSANGDVICTVTYFKNGNKSESSKTINLKVEIRESDIKVVLDSIDINTLNIINNHKLSYNIKKINGVDSFTIDGYRDNFNNTYSIFNIFQGLNIINKSEDLFFTKIQCVGKIMKNDTVEYETGVSNRKSFLYEDVELINDNSLKINISNLRHLFNTCYLETMSNKNNLTVNYYQVSDIEYKNVPIYSSINDIRGLSQNQGFPSIPVFSSNSVLNGKDEKSGEQYSINDIILDSKILLTCNNYSSDKKKTLGLFQKNDGTICNIILNNVSVYSDVESTDSSNNRNDMDFGSGGIAGINSGTISECAIDNGVLNGYVNLGGIVGINYGNIEDSKSNVKFNPKTKESYNFGGIAGLNKKNTAIISNCEYTTTNYLNLEILENDIFKDVLKGFHIGGIVGKNATFATVKDCKTTSKNNGYIIGYGSVGGIIGICDSTSIQAGTYVNNVYETYNEANVIGVDCVGGIVANYAVGTANVTLSNWENRGAVVVYKDDDNPGKYGGGITAYLNVNGTIQNCWSNITFDSDYENDVKYNLVRKYSKGDYVGGLVGEQRGYISNPTVVQHKVLVGGGEYVGGIVGSPDADFTDRTSVLIKNQQVIDGIVTGEKYIGGLSGTTQLEIQFDNSVLLNHSFTMIEGDNYVGGLTGYHQKGNLNKNTIDIAYIVVNGQYGGGIAGKIEEMLEANDLTTLKSITIKGGSYIGGLVGYNDSKKINKYSVDNVTINSPSGNNIGGLIGYNSGMLTSDGLCQTTANVTGNSFVGGIVGDNAGTIEKRQLNNSTITGNGDYVGGIAGRNSNGLNNNAKANHTIISVTGKNYVGGLVGENSGSVDKHGLNKIVVSGNGSYIGGIAGFNSNSIKRDEDTAVEVSITNNLKESKYTGGIVGKNDTSGNIEKYYVFDGSVSSLGSYVGGIAGENLGNIKTGNSNISDKITVSGSSFVGGIVGNNNGYFEKISFNKYIVNGNGDYVGGIAGYNSSNIKAGENKSVIVNVENKYDKSTYTGGIVGKNEQSSYIEKYYVYDGTVTSLGSYVGGIAGENLGSIKTDNYDGSTTTVTVSGNSYIGGLVGNNKGELEKIYFKNYTISGTGTRTGGLFGSNTGKYTLDQDTEMLFIVNGKDFTGGLVGYNDSGSEIKKAKLSVESKINGTDNVGWLCGYNAGNIYADNKTDYKVNVTGRSNVGGLIGVYAGGRLEKQTIKTGKINATGNFVGGVFGVCDSNFDREITLDNLNIKGNAYIGGIFGNYNTDKNITIKAKINGLSAEGTDFVGGVVPVLDSNVVLDSANDYGVFDNVNLIVKNGTGGIVTAVNNTHLNGLKFNNCILIANGDSNIGSVSGINKGTIENITVNSLMIKYNYTSNVNAGSVAGINHGTISNSVIYDTNFEHLPQILEGAENNNVILNIGEVSGINGNINDLNIQSQITGCKVFDVLSNEEIVKEISGLNLYKINNCSFVADHDKNIVDTAKSSSQFKNSPSITDVNITDNSIGFKFATDGEYSISLYGLSIKDSKCIDNKIDLSTSSIVCANNLCTLGYSSDTEKYDGYRVVIENEYDNNSNKLPSLVDEVHYNKVKLNTVYPIIEEKEDGSYTLKWSKNEEQFKYIDGFEIFGSINSSKEVKLAVINRELAQSDITLQKNLTDLNGDAVSIEAGNTIRFAIVANSNNSSGVYENSERLYSQEFTVKSVIDNVTVEEASNESGNPEGSEE